MRFRNPIFGIISFLVAGLFLHMVKETSWAIFVERVLEEAAHSLHIEKAAMMASLVGPLQTTQRKRPQPTGRTEAVCFCENSDWWV
jgi:hypothetical protein